MVAHHQKILQTGLNYTIYIIAPLPTAHLNYFTESLLNLCKCTITRCLAITKKFAQNKTANVCRWRICNFQLTIQHTSWLMQSLCEKHKKCSNDWKNCSRFAIKISLTFLCVCYIHLNVYKEKTCVLDVR